MNKFSFEAFNRLPIIGILRGFSRDETCEILKVYQASGLTTLEITLNTKDAPELISDSVKLYGEAMNIGAGTVCTMEELDRALASGAQFIVTPILDIAIISKCVSLGIPIFPGAYSPTEIFRAWEAGASMVKVFPAGVLGPDYIKQVKAPLNTIKLLPTGGINLKNIQNYLDAGSDGFGLGNSLFDQDLIAAGDWTGLEKHFDSYVQILKTANQS